MERREQAWHNFAKTGNPLDYLAFKQSSPEQQQKRHENR